MFSPPVSDCDTCPLAPTGRPCPFRPLHYRAGARLCRQGEVAPRVFFVRRGVVALSSVTQDGSEGEVSLRGPRSLLCAEALHGAVSPREVRALSPLTVCAVSRGELERWLGPEESATRRFVSLLIGEVERHQDETELRQGGALGRVARLLCLLSHDPELQTIPKNVLARSLGLRAETFARCLTRLVCHGLVDARPKLRIKDPAGLRAVASAGLPEAMPPIP